MPEIFEFDACHVSLSASNSIAGRIEIKTLRDVREEFVHLADLEGMDAVTLADPDGIAMSVPYLEMRHAFRSRQFGDKNAALYADAIAIAVIEYLQRHEALVLATTHHRAVKSFAASRAGVNNASVRLDPVTSKPTYTLHPGIAGASSGLEIARQLGLAEEIIAGAKAVLDGAELQVESYLQGAMGAFDRAVEVYRTQVPYGFKLHPYVRPYFLRATQEMMDRGYHREAMIWVWVCHWISNAALQNDAPEDEKVQFQAGFDRLLEDMGLSTPEEIAAQGERTRALAEEIFQAAEHPKSFVSLDRADHLISDRADSLYLGNLVAAWARKYVRLVEERVPARDLADNRVIVRTGEIGYQTEIVANDHHLVADEPLGVGGANTGPTPYEFLVAGLGACTSMTIRMYADRKKWPVKGIVVRLKHSKIHQKDCEECDTKSRKIDFIEREIELLGPLSSQQRGRLLEIADRCPVHRTLRSETLIESRLRE